MQQPRDAPELLAPVGNWDCLRAAAENGADAVYFGLQSGFNARVRAGNFTVDELPEVMFYLRSRSLRGYLTLNTLVFSSELDELERITHCISDAGVDAVLVQDLGAARLIRAICPQLVLHASTQMTLTSAESIRVAQRLGIGRVVLARELSVAETSRIRAASEIPLESFVHGALCVAYSGQCLTSESLGGRSANRGHCAQACRLPYQLVCDGKDVDLGAQQYLLSPQDLAAYDLIGDLMAAGVRSFKIEGRLKSPEYVANITRHYRIAIDRACEGLPADFSHAQITEMELSFSRGFSHGWLQGCDHKMLVPGTSSAKRGVRLGTIQRLSHGRVHVQLENPVSRGDGLVFSGDRSCGQEQGGRVYGVFREGRRVEQPVEQGVVELVMDRDAVDLRRLVAGQAVWKTDDPQLTRRLRKSYSGKDPVKRVALDLKVEARVGGALRVRGSAASGASCDVLVEGELAVARRHPASLDQLRAKLGRLGGTVYQLRELEADLEGGPMVPLSVLGLARHEMTRQLDDSLRTTLNARPTVAGALAALRPPPRSPPKAIPGTLHVLCRSLKQLRWALESEVHDLVVDLQDLRECREAVAIARDHNARIRLATPRIQKPGEYGLFQAMLRYEPDGVLARNLAGIEFFVRHQCDVVADYSLNATNELTVDFLKSLGVSRITASYDLNREQLMQLVGAVDAMDLEIVIHQHMPMFHMEHCVYCAVLSPGTDKTNCGRPCDVHEVRIRDRIGMEHPLHADVGCRNTVFNAVAQSSAEVARQLQVAGVGNLRIELLDLPRREVHRTIAAYRQLLSGELSGTQVWQQLQAINRVGVTRGSLEERNPLAII